eukprot:CAMPEP_0113846320 /NCGR_PEP_ID=MMETSP0372-20130328/1244_1 /TAXON_ID=340204 /ORGANISM="Lankesteria abbotti" /LENGTH=250 /DNA_ID=CAMNT_0000815455 /DNA_START=24 /DNA_END=776 /DNA_ORIENTATION=+ /assembly_acc=CAM_ASM_000359
MTVKKFLVVVACIVPVLQVLGYSELIDSLESWSQPRGVQQPASSNSKPSRDVSGDKISNVISAAGEAAGAFNNPSNYLNGVASNVEPNSIVTLFGKAFEKAQQMAEESNPDSLYVTAMGFPCNPNEKKLCFRRTTSTTSTTTMGPLEKKKKAREEAEREALLALAAKIAAGEEEWNPFVDAPPEGFADEANAGLPSTQWVDVVDADSYSDNNMDGDDGGRRAQRGGSWETWDAEDAGTVDKKRQRGRETL